MTGTTYKVPPIPLDEAHTTYVDAGPLRIGVEYRLLDDAELAANYEGDEMVEIQDALNGADVQDNGASIHILGREDGHEYLRFDLFEQGPHYHYIDLGGEEQTIVDYDRVALGEMLPWALVQLRDRIVPMLEHAGGEKLASAVEAHAAQLHASLPEVERLVKAAQAELANAKGE
ncbi:MAG: hypothetical protein P8Q97_06645 [Myxococcota bacterium]|jgi:hypothetical protein|nr:hypothetical protein [Myxococcota bacterium]